MQRVFRGHAGRKEVEKRNNAATTLQVIPLPMMHPAPSLISIYILCKTTYRGYDARRKYDTMLEKLEEQEMETMAANMLQVWSDALMTDKKFLKFCFPWLSQAAVKGHLEFMNYKVQCALPLSPPLGVCTNIRHPASDLGLLTIACNIVNHANCRKSRRRRRNFVWIFSFTAAASLDCVREKWWVCALSISSLLENLSRTVVSFITWACVWWFNSEGRYICELSERKVFNYRHEWGSEFCCAPTR